MPGLAVADALAAREPGCRIVFVGSDRPLEKHLVKARACRHYALPVESSLTLRRNPLKFLWRNWRAYCQALRILKDEQPCAVIGLGGFASVPLVFAATRHGVPTMILEQNLLPGRATRWLSRYANRVCVSFAATHAHLARNAKVELTGNPVRKEISHALQTAALAGPDEQRTLLILGGSQGAAPLNEAILQMVTREQAAFAGWRIVHQTGRDQLQLVRSTYERLAIDHAVDSFFADMPERYRQATLAISRAGATTLAELACAGCPAILVPYPHAADNHQLRNAQVYEAAGGARVVMQDQDANVTTERLAAAALPLMCDRESLNPMRRAMLSVAQPDATEQVVQILSRLLKDS